MEGNGKKQERLQIGVEGRGGGGGGGGEEYEWKEAGEVTDRGGGGGGGGRNMNGKKQERLQIGVEGGGGGEEDSELKEAGEVTDRGGERRKEMKRGKHRQWQFRKNRLTECCSPSCREFIKVLEGV